ncbi:MAG: tripartite tricarboxylate transporter substrate binding protein [Pseudomonadota bacterium]|nr:tripartite tricarboxylate transporter substrate binding protein [Pseudomonadota bacterium]
MRKSIVLLLGCLLAVSMAQAQTFPSKPVRIINPFAPGGATDIIARHMAQKLTELWGQPVIVENRAGASGAIGVEAVAKSPPDGYTLLIATQTTHAANPALYAKLPYDAATDFAPLTLAGSTPLALLVHPSLPVSSVKELLDFARKNPGKVIYASGGNGSSQHLAAELMASMSQTSMVHIPYKGAGPAMTDLLGGHVQVMFDNLPTALPHIRSGRLRALAVSTSARSPLAPDLPTIAESGLPGFDLATWFAFFAPAGTPRDIVDKISTDMRKVLAQQESRERLSAAGVDVRGTTPEELAQFHRAEMVKWAKIVKDSGAKLD